MESALSAASGTGPMVTGTGAPSVAITEADLDEGLVARISSFHVNPPAG